MERAFTLSGMPAAQGRTPCISTIIVTPHPTPLRIDCFFKVRRRLECSSADKGGWRNALFPRMPHHANRPCPISRTNSAIVPNETVTR